MNRLQKKCFVVSAGLHLLLPMILVFGSALTPRSKPAADDMPVLTIIPAMTTDLAVAPQGGNPQVRTAPPEFVKPIAPVTPPPQPAQKPEEKQVVEKDKPEESFEPRKDNKRKLPDVPTKVVARKNPNAPKSVAKKPVDDSEQRRLDEARKKLATEIASTANDLRENTSTSVKFSDTDFAGFGGGVPYANFLQAVKTIYTRAWNVPDGVEDDDITTEVSVTIARDGKVVRASIIKRCGNASVDHSVQLTLDRVRYVAPLPATAKQDERTVTIGFNVRAKRGIG